MTETDRASDEPTGIAPQDGRNPARIRVFRRVEWVDTDKSGRWHNTTAFRMFEVAESSLWAHLGGREAFGDIPRVRIDVSFHEEANYLDVLTVDAWVKSVGRTSLTYGFAISRDETRCAEGTVVVVRVDKATGKAAPIPSNLRMLLETAGTLTTAGPGQEVPVP